MGRLSFRVQQLNVRVETKTLDNVFLEAVVSVQYQVLRDKCYEAFYALTNPLQQITAHVYDVRTTTSNQQFACVALYRKRKQLKSVLTICLAHLSRAYFAFLESHPLAGYALAVAHAGTRLGL